MAQILVVDDDPPIRDTLRFLLEDVGYTVVEAPDGVVALRVLRASAAPMVVLLDVMMPRLNGYQVLAAVAGDPCLSRHTFIMLTASPRPRAVTLADLWRQVSVPILQKPFDVDELLQLVARMEERLSDLSSSNGETDMPATSRDSIEALDLERRFEAAG
jgi:CheY-like chemotaxis protein